MRARSSTDGSVIVVVLVTLIFTAAALVAFLQKASNDLLVVSHVAVANRLREDAHSALEVTLAVLEDFRLADQGLRSSGEGWGTPLDWAGWTPPAGRTVEVAFQDESGKLPLPRVGNTEMVNVFKYWEMNDNDAQHLADVLLTWMRPNHPPTVSLSPDYQQDNAPFDPPLRSMRSYDELAAIDYARDIFYTPDGRRNDRWWRFYNDFSLFNYQQPNINGANQDVLAAAGQFNDAQQLNIANFLAGKGDFVTPSPLGVQWFKDESEIQNVVGPAGNVRIFGHTITALRITVTVHEGKSAYRLSVVVAPQGGATTVQTTATDAKKNTSSAQAGETNTTNVNRTAQPSSTASSAQASAAAAANIQYPFTVLEIKENDEILTPPPPPPPSS